MAKNEEIKKNNLKRALILLKSKTISQANKKLQTQCMGRLGLSQREYEFCYKILKTPINREIISEDRTLYRKEYWVRHFCKKLKISSSVLKNRIERLIPIKGMSSKQLLKVRRALDIKFNNSKYHQQIRSLQMKLEQQNIIKMWNSGNTYRQISVKLGLPFGTLTRRVSKMREIGLNIPIRNPGGFVRENGFNVDNIVKLIKSGTSVKNIAIKFNKKPSSLYSLICIWRTKFGSERIPYIKTIKNEVDL